MSCPSPHATPCQHSRSLRLPLLSTLLVAGTAWAQTPIRMQYDSGTTGPDGPWHTLNISLGVPARALPMLPSLGNTTMAVAASACADATVEKPCPAPEQPLWQVSEAYNGGAQESGLLISEDWDPGMSHFGGMYGEAVVMPQRVTLVDFGEGGGGEGLVLRARQGAVSRSENLTVNYPGGRGYTLNTGFFSLNGLDEDLEWTTPDGDAKSRKRTLVAAYEDDYIPSLSYGLHVGSPSLDIPGSLVLGGYDSSRFLSAPITIQSTSLDSLELLDISLNVSGRSAYLTLPSDGGHVDNLLLDANNNPSTLNVTPDPGLPYLYLPKPTCEALVTYLPIRYNQGLNLYLWDTEAAAYSQILSSLHYLAFTFADPNAGNSNSTIRLPLALLNLTLTPPLVEAPTQYFPCSPWDPQAEGRSAALGRAFLQGAAMGQNWGQEVLWLSQAPGPGFAAESVRGISGDATQLEVGEGSMGWEDSWKGALKRLGDDDGDADEASGDADVDSAAAAAGSQDEDNGGLSAGAIAGIAIAIVVAVLGLVGFFVWRLLQRRRRGRGDLHAGEGDAGSELMGHGEPRCYADQETPGEKQYQKAMHEVDGSHGVVEMGDGRGGVVELPGHEVGELAAEVPGKGERGKG